MTLAMMVMMILAPLSLKLQTGLARVLDALGPNHFENATGKIFSEQLRKVEKKSSRLVTEELQRNKKMQKGWLVIAKLKPLSLFISLL